MELGTILGTGILLLISMAAVLQPFAAKSRAGLFGNETQKARDELLTSYERVLSTIRDLDEDYNTGKLEPDTYKSERSYWTEQGIALLQQLEPQEDAPRKSNKKQVDTAADDEVEKAIAAYRKSKA